MPEVLRLTLSALLGCVVAGVGYWAMIGRDVPTRDEVGQMIQTQAPYVEDRIWVRDLIERNTLAIEKLDETVTDLRIFLASGISPPVAQ